MRKDANVQHTENGYTLLTSQIENGDEIECPDKDMVTKKISAEEVEVTFTKKVKITRS